MRKNVRKKYKNHRELQAKLDLVEEILGKLQSTRLAYIISEFTENDDIAQLMLVMGHLGGIGLLRYNDVRKEQLRFRTPFVPFMCASTDTVNHLIYLLESGYVPLHHQWQLTVRLLDSQLILENIATSHYACEFFYLLEPSPVLRLMIDRNPFPSQRQLILETIHDDMESLAIGMIGFYETFYGAEYWKQILKD